jgi:hypothetical protein
MKRGRAQIVQASLLKVNYLRGRGVLFVMPAKVGIQFTRYRLFWIPAFAGMTVCIAENSPTAQLFIMILIKYHNSGLKSKIKDLVKID